MLVPRHSRPLQTLLFSILALGLFPHSRKNPKLRTAHGNRHIRFVLFFCVWTAENTDGLPELCSWFLPSWCYTTFLCNRFHAEWNLFMIPWNSFTTSFAHLKYHFSIRSVPFWMLALTFVMRFVIFKALGPWLGQWGPLIWDNQDTLQKSYCFEPCIWPNSLRIWLHLVW